MSLNIYLNSSNRMQYIIFAIYDFVKKKNNNKHLATFGTLRDFTISKVLSATEALRGTLSLYIGYSIYSIPSKNTGTDGLPLNILGILSTSKPCEIAKNT